ncbi:sigma-54 interaction domain-containing protein [Thiohalorhabdus sp.]|uniref:sigma-54 interaction domain-containing protein n=1 Tax=Thiohalorhabdus sp. TaxID=3094134 RepID=UPI002FC318C6
MAERTEAWQDETPPPDEAPREQAGLPFQGPTPRVIIGPGLEEHNPELVPVAAASGLDSEIAGAAPAPGPAVVLADLSAGTAGWDFLACCRSSHIPVAVFTVPAEPSDVREAYRRGVAEVLFLEEAGLDIQLSSLLTRLYDGPDKKSLHPERSRFHSLVGLSQSMAELYSLLEVVGPSDATVLVRGESGTGKELVARAIHAESGRSEHPFVAINCGAIPPDLLEAELFGHAKGAFTGAVSARQGRFAHADSGTLFLDEIGEMSPDLQIKLLRVLEERTYEPVGSSRSVPFNARVLAATNKDLDEAVASGRFREDLYHRLNVLTVDLPPLRQRGSEDVMFLFDHFLDELNRKHSTGVAGADPVARRFLEAYDWPGNVRELRNLTERLAVLKREGLVEPADLPEKIRGAPRDTNEGQPAEVGAESGERDILLGQSRDLRAEVEAFENRLILEALESTAGNRNQAAQLLGVKRTTLVEKLKKRNLG